MYSSLQCRSSPLKMLRIIDITSILCIKFGLHMTFIFQIFVLSHYLFMKMYSIDMSVSCWVGLGSRSISKIRQQSLCNLLHAPKKTCTDTSLENLYLSQSFSYKNASTNRALFVLQNLNFVYVFFISKTPGITPINQFRIEWHEYILQC